MAEIQKETKPAPRVHKEEQRSGPREYRPRDSQGGGRSEYGGRGRNYPRYRDRIDFKSLKIDYKKPDILRKFVTEQGKILPRRVTGIPAKMQRKVVREIKRARFLALLSFRNS